MVLTHTWTLFYIFIFKGERDPRVGGSNPAVSIFSYNNPHPTVDADADADADAEATLTTHAIG